MRPAKTPAVAANQWLPLRIQDDQKVIGRIILGIFFGEGAEIDGSGRNLAGNLNGSVQP
ncbi:MAG TPA: hypothetical protein VFL62_06135 [Bradyrhizobium sp.]|uniref:hypothetical protein n=1 Tax=Bradyrhizobium sp. TaxID=376 RepID=UPI002D7E3066|nr:hypothetical protein [Bradyrhizobium sp.]HET7885788.1 hypothetical protein [Bradyrhizobium sp.]